MRFTFTNLESALAKQEKKIARFYSRSLKTGVGSESRRAGLEAVTKPFQNLSPTAGVHLRNRLSGISYETVFSDFHPTYRYRVLR
jgi:hypothetical protein